MTLEGTLEAFGVAEVLEMLAGAAKTGRLRVEGDGGRAMVRLHDGAVISAASDRASGSPLDEVICDLLRYERGSFAFEADDGTAGSDGEGNGNGNGRGVRPGRDGRASRDGRSGRDGREAVPELLARAGTLLAERRELEAVVPSLDHRVGLTRRLADGGHVTISAEQWTALVAVGAGCTVGEMAATLGLSELAALRTVHGLVTAGLTTVTAAEPRAGWRARSDAEPSRPPQKAGLARRPRRDEHPAEVPDPGIAPNGRDAGAGRDAPDGRDGRDARDVRHALDGRAGRVGRDAPGGRRPRRDARSGEVWNPREAGHDDEEPPETWPAGDGLPWRPPAPRPEPESELEPEPDPERRREGYWPDPPPLGSRG